MKLIQILENFLDTNTIWKQFFAKNKEEFKNIRERLIEISHKYWEYLLQILKN